MSTKKQHDDRRAVSTESLDFYLPAMASLSTEPGPIGRFLRRLNRSHLL